MAATLKHRMAQARESGTLGVDATPEQVMEERLSVVPNIRLPHRWGELPESAKWEDEVEWVHNNRVLVVGRTKAGLVRLDWNLAKTAAPSMGAVGLMQDAAANPQWFSRDILSKAKRGGEEDDPERLVEERRRLGDVRELLGQFAERVRAESGALRGDPPGLLES